MNDTPEAMYNCNDLLQEYQSYLEHASNADYQMYEHRIDVLISIINCGVEYTTISKLNQIH